MQDIKSKKGFTIIEVVLVLAIAGLIFLMVFIALPAMQKNQRDTQRRNDYSLLSTAMTNYMTNNNGSLPTSFSSGDASKYINEDGKDPNGFAYNLELLECPSTASDTVNCHSDLDSVTNATTEDATTVYVVKKAGCENGHVVYRKSSRAFAIYGQLESGNGTYCSASS